MFDTRQKVHAGEGRRRMAKSQDSEPLRQSTRNGFGRFRSETHARIEVIGACPLLSRREKDVEDGAMSARLRAAPDAQQTLVFLYNVSDQ